jgi:hypothetical protein
MFSTARMELKRLIELERKVAAFDATMVADRTIVPEESARERRNRWEQEAVALSKKYELLN